MDYCALIRTHFSARNLKDVLEALEEQTLPPVKIVIVDNDSADETRSIAKKHNCTIIEYPRGQDFNYSRALNLGYLATSSTFVLNLSSHVVLSDKTTAERMLAELSLKPNACGCYLGNQVGKIADLVLSEMKTKVSIIDLGNFSGNNGLFNSAAMIRRSYWNLYHFREDIPSCEDQEWSYWHMKHSNSIVLRIDWPQALYLNRYANCKKIARDYLVIGSFIMPNYLSLKNIPHLLARGIRGMLRGNRIQTGSSFLIAWWLLIRRHRNMDLSSRYW